MAHELVPKDGGFLAPAVVADRLGWEFDSVDVDEQAGADHVASMVAHIFGMDPAAEQIDRLRRVQSQTLAITAHDDNSEEPLRFFVIPNEPILISYYSAQHQEQLQPLVHRAARALGYRIKLL